MIVEDLRGEVETDGLLALLAGPGCECFSPVFDTSLLKMSLNIHEQLYIFSMLQRA